MLLMLGVGLFEGFVALIESELEKILSDERGFKDFCLFFGQLGSLKVC